MPKMVSLQMSKKEAKEGLNAPVPKDMDLPRYPYGTTLRLDTETLKKLGIDLDDYPIDAECEIVAKGVVTDLNQSQRQGGEKRQSMEVQITDLLIAESKASKKKKAEEAHMNSISATAGDTADEY